MKKDKKIDVRSYWCVGFTKSANIQKLEEKILEYNDEHYDIKKYLTTKRKGQTPYSMIVF